MAYRRRQGMARSTTLNQHIYHPPMQENEDQENGYKIKKDAFASPSSSTSNHRLSSPSFPFSNSKGSVVHNSDDYKYGFWGVLATKAKSLLDDDQKPPQRSPKVTNHQLYQPPNPSIIEESRGLHIRTNGINASDGTQPGALSNPDTQLKASRDVAMATAAKAKLLLRELKTTKAELAFAKDRSTQLEDENKQLRDNRIKGDNHTDDDMIRLQLEILLAEKTRLAQENSILARENRFLREIVEYHQLTMQDLVDVDEAEGEVTTSIYNTPKILFQNECNEAPYEEPPDDEEDREVEANFEPAIRDAAVEEEGRAISPTSNDI